MNHPGQGSARVTVTALRQATAARVPGALLVALAAGVAWEAGKALAMGGQRGAAAGLLAVTAALGPLAVPAVLRRLPPGTLQVELPVLLLVAATIVLRGRSANALLANPFDRAGLYRIACVGAAGLLGVAALLSAPPRRPRPRAPAALLLFAGYVAVVFVGAPLSLHPTLTAYRGVELTAAALVVGAALRAREDAVPRLEALLYWLVVAHLATVVLSLVVSPASAVEHLTNGDVPVPYNVQGLYPQLSANTIGTLGVLLTVWSLAGLWSGRLPRGVRPGVARAMAVFGVAALLGAQYRTGYVALPFALLVVLVAARRWLPVLATAMVLVGVLLWNPHVVSDATPYALRGSTPQEASQLDSRVMWWSASLPVWEESPVIGRGLLTATRYEVLGRLQQQNTSSIHGTWVEALVGTGLLGVTLLASSVLVGLGTALVSARRHHWFVPLGLLSVLVVRSITGPTFELFDFPVVLFLVLLLHPLARTRPGTVGDVPADRRTQAAARPS